jgi:hypothetical protein
MQSGYYSNPLPYRILPKSVVIFFVRPHTVIPAFGNFNSKLVSPLAVTLGSTSNNSTALLENMWSSPHNIRGIKQALCRCIISNFNWVAFLDIRQVLPACCSISSFKTQVPTLDFFPQ